MTADPQAVLDASLAGWPDGTPAPRIGVAVSGGGDSMALLHLAHRWAIRQGATVMAATVDHGLRATSGAEAQGVAAACAVLGVAHATLDWRGWDGAGNLQSAARDARRHLLADWATRNGLDRVLLGHTADDQAETVLMRLARGSGVDGLAGMAGTDATGLFLRPLLAVTRATLRAWLVRQGIAWIEDPSNDDPRFDRVKARRALALLAPLGLTQDRLIATAGHMARAQRSLWARAAEFAKAHVGTDAAGDLILDAAALRLDHSDTEGRVFAAAVQWIGGTAHRPRHDALTEAASALAQGQARTLGGVALLPDGQGGARMLREPAAVMGPVPAPADPGKVQVWDGRWGIERLTRDYPGGTLRVAALGETGLLACKGWRDTGLLRRSLLSSPAVWDGDTLLAAPVAGLANGWKARIVAPFHRFPVSD